MSERTFSTTEIVGLTDASFRQVDHWTRLGIIEPEGPAFPGSGQQRRYSERELMIVAVVATLSELGAPLDTVCREVANQLRCAPELTFLVDRVYVSAEGDLLWEPQGSCWCVDLGSLFATAD